MNEDIIEHEDKTFEKVDYQGKMVLDRKFINCVFKNCNLANTTFKSCLFDECTFESCDLSLMKVNNSIFKKLQITDSKAIGVQWFDARSPFSITLRGCNISYSSFFGKELKKVKINRCIAKETDFSECSLIEANFDGTDLTDARFRDSDLTSANFTQATGYVIDVRYNKVKKARFRLPEALSLLNAFDIIVD